MSKCGVATFQRTHPVRVPLAGKDLPTLVRHDPDINEGRRRVIDAACVIVFISCAAGAYACYRDHSFLAGALFDPLTVGALVAFIIGFANHQKPSL